MGREREGFACLRFTSLSYNLTEESRFGDVKSVMKFNWAAYI